MPPPKPKAFCDFLRRRCRKCGQRFQKKRDRFITHCHCGESRRCNRPVVPNFSRCQDHGGPNANKGIIAMSRDLKQFPLVKLADKYNQMQRDGRILSNRASIEIIRSRIQQLLERVDVQDAPNRLEKIGDYWAEYMQNKMAGNMGEMAKIERQITAQVNAAREDYAIWAQMFEAIDLDSKLVEREMKVVKEIRAFLTMEDAYDLVAKLLSVVTDVVEDPEKLRIIQYRFTKLIGDKTDPKNEPIDVDSEDVE
jgi:hypothetical protein